MKRHEVVEAFQRGLFAGRPRALDELDEPDAKAVTRGAQHGAEGGGRLALAIPRIDDQQALLGSGCLDAPGLHFLALGHLCGVPPVDLGLGRIGHGWSP